ncbi:MAG: metalloregulator ArsR/SmtB family transcription factor [Emcibacteraceae bacterium]
MNKLGEGKCAEGTEIIQISGMAAEFLKTLANPNRLIILGRLMKGELCVSDLEKKLDISQSALSQHLSKMRGQGILARRRDRQQIYYSISDRRVEKFIDLTSELFCKK